MSSVRHLEPSSSLVWSSKPCLHFGIQSHFPIWHSIPSSFSLGIQNRCAYSFRHLESSFFLLFGIQKFFFLNLYYSEAQLLAFIFTGIAHFAFTILHSSSFSSPRYLVLISCSSCSSRLPLPLHMTQSFEFTTYISVMLLGLHLPFSCSSHRAVPFGRIFFLYSKVV